MHNRPSKEGIPSPLALLWAVSYFPLQSKSTSSHWDLQFGILSSPSQPPAIPELSPTLPLCFHFPLNLRSTNPTFYLEEHRSWTKRDVCLRAAIGTPLIPAYFRGGLELEPSLPGPLAVVLSGHAQQPGCVQSLSPALIFPLTSPFFCLSLSPVNSVKANIFDSHFIYVLIDVCAYQWVGYQGLEKDGAALSPWIICSGDRKPPSSTHHLTKPYIPAFTSQSMSSIRK